MTKNALAEVAAEPVRIAEAQDLLMEASFIVEFLEEAACCAGESEHAIHETSGLIYILGDIRRRMEKADQIIDAYKAEKKETCQP